SPSGGRTYNATGAAGSCVSGGQPGWAGPGPGWMQSTWTATDLKSTQFAGKKIQLDVGYGTDALTSLAGFWFDELTVTNFDLQVADTQSNTCAFPKPGESNPLTLSKSGGNLVFNWTAPVGCAPSNFAIYQGTIGALQTAAYDH